MAQAVLQVMVGCLPWGQHALLHAAHMRAGRNVHLALTDSAGVQAYLILDEFILAGELQESSKHVILERIASIDMLDMH